MALFVSIEGLAYVRSPYDLVVVQSLMASGINWLHFWAMDKNGE